MAKQSPHKTWKGCQACKPHKNWAYGQAACKPLSELRRLGKSRRVSRHELGE